MSFVDCTDDHPSVRLSIISRGGILGILVAGGLIVGTFIPGHPPHKSDDPFVGQCGFTAQLAVSFPGLNPVLPAGNVGFGDETRRPRAAPMNRCSASSASTLRSRRLW